MALGDVGPGSAGRPTARPEPPGSVGALSARRGVPGAGLALLLLAAPVVEPWELPPFTGAGAGAEVGGEEGCGVAAGGGTPSCVVAPFDPVTADFGCDEVSAELVVFGRAAVVSTVTTVARG